MSRLWLLVYPDGQAERIAAADGTVPAQLAAPGAVTTLPYKYTWRSLDGTSADHNAPAARVITLLRGAASQPPRGPVLFGTWRQDRRARRQLAQIAHDVGISTLSDRIEAGARAQSADPWHHLRGAQLDGLELGCTAAAAQGLTSRQTARNLGVSEAAVHTALARARAKHQARSTTHLVAIVIGLGLIDPPASPLAAA